MRHTTSVTVGVLGVLLLTVLAASAPVTSATDAEELAQASEELVVGSQHSTDSEFQNAQALTNLTVEGSGESASVDVLQTTDGIATDGFEDQDYAEYTAQGTDTGGWGFTTAAQVGSYAASYTSDGDTNHEMQVRDTTSTNLTMEGWVSSSGEFVGYKFGASNPSNGVRTFINVAENNLVIRNDGSGSQTRTDVDLSSSTYYYLATTYYQHNNTAKAWLDDDSNYRDSPIETLSYDVGSVDGEQYGLWQFDRESVEKRWDEVTYETGGFEPITSGAYVSGTHEVSGAEEAAINIEQASNVSVDAEVRTDDGTTLATDTFTSASNHTLNLSETSSSQLETVLDVSVTGEDPQFSLADESILFTPHAPSASNLSPESGSMLDTRDTTFSVDVSDEEFSTAQGDSVDTRLFVDGEQVASETATSNGTVSLNHQMTDGGEHTYHWELEDSYGETTTTSERTINVPGELSVYNVSAPDQLIDNSGEIELTFYTYDESNEVFTRSVTDGTVDLTGLPVDQELTVTANVDGYYARQTIIRSLYDQQAIYLLNDNRSSYETQFQLNDNTGGSFSDNEPRIIVERALNQSGDTQWVNIAGGRFGVNDYQTTLEANERYRLTVRNSQGDERVFYPYDAESAQVVPLDVGSVSASAGSGDSYITGAGYSNETGTPVVNFEYVDEANATTAVSISVHERGNENNVLVNDTWTDTYGTLDLTWTIPDDSRDSSWVIEYSANRNGETVSGQSVVGPQQTILEEIPVWLKTIISIGTIFIVAGLFSRANGAIGGIITAGLGGMWWFVGFLPNEIGVGVVVLAFLTAGMIFARGSGGAYA